MRSPPASVASAPPAAHHNNDHTRWNETGFQCGTDDHEPDINTPKVIWHSYLWEWIRSQPLEASTTYLLDKGNIREAAPDELQNINGRGLFKRLENGGLIAADYLSRSIYPPTDSRLGYELYRVNCVIPGWNRKAGAVNGQVSFYSDGTIHFYPRVLHPTPTPVSRVFTQPPTATPHPTPTATAEPTATPVLEPTRHSMCSTFRIPDSFWALSSDEQYRLIEAWLNMLAINFGC